MIAVSLIALVGLLTACSSIDRGTITEKVNEPSSTVVTQQCIARNSSGICTGWMPQVIHDDEDWRFNLRNEKDTGWVYVDEGTYNKYEVGDFYNGEG